MKHSYKKIVTHHRPGLDEIASIFLLKRHGAEWGIDEDTPVRFMANGDFENLPMPEVNEVLYVGCGIDSWANEHFCDEPDRSACYLVARELQLCRRRYKWLVHLVTKEDRYGTDNVQNHIAQAIKDLYDMGWTFTRVYKWVKTALVALTSHGSYPDKFALDTETCARSIEKKFGKESAVSWFSVISGIKTWDKGEFAKSCAYLDKNPQLFTEVDTYKGKMKAFIPDDVQFSPRIGAAARAKGAQIVLMQGILDFDQVGIMLQQKHTAGLSFSKVLEELRKHELVQCGELNHEKSADCAGEGTKKVCPVWHGHQSAKGQYECFAIYNRSKTRPCGPKTAMSWDYLRDLVLDTIKVAPEGEIINGLNNVLAGGADLHRVFENK